MDTENELELAEAYETCMGAIAGAVSLPPCSDCGGDGEVALLNTVQECERCRGRGIATGGHGSYSTKKGFRR